MRSMSSQCRDHNQLVIAAMMGTAEVELDVLNARSRPGLFKESVHEADTSCQFTSTEESVLEADTLLQSMLILLITILYQPTTRCLLSFDKYTTLGLSTSSARPRFSTVVLMGEIIEPTTYASWQVEMVDQKRPTLTTLVQ